MAKMNIKYRFLRLVNMSDDLDHVGASNSIRNGIQFQGANVFILACAIIIASVGLNVNSIYDDLNDAVAREIMVQYPLVSRVLLGNARMLSSGTDAQSGTQYTVLLELPTLLSQTETDKLKAWLRVRLNREQVDIIQFAKNQ